MASEIREIQTEDEWVDLAQLCLDTFGGDEDAETVARQWRDGFGSPSIGLVVVDGPQVIGGVCATPVEQFFGGRPVWGGAPIGGCLRPEYRRAEVGSTLMQRMIGMMEDSGLAISSGWPATVSVFRRLGWEVIGRDVSHAVDARQLLGLTAPGGLEPDPFVNRRPEAIELQRRCAANWNGPFLRTETWWDDHQPVGNQRHRQRYGWVEDGVLTGFVCAERRPERRIWVSDLWTATPNALLGLLGFLGAQETVIDRVDFGPGAQPGNDELSAVLPRPKVVLEAGQPWMLRYVDLIGALDARGYPTGLSCRLDLEVVARPGGGSTMLSLEVDAGRAKVVEGGSGALRIEQRALTAWYAGSLAAPRAATLGLVHGTPSDIDTLGLLAGDRSPWLPEVF